MIKIILCDDRAEDRLKYSNLLNRLGRKHRLDLEIVKYEDGRKLLFDMESRKFQVDIIYLDIHMPHVDGIEVARKIREYGYTCEIVFLTISQDHLLSAFDVGAFNYIIKNICTPQRFEEIFSKVVKKSEEKHKEYICFTGGGESKNIAISTIRYFEVTNRIVTVFYNTKGKFEFYSTMAKLENQLLSRGFIRVHRSYLVSLDYIEVLNYGKIKMRDGTMIPVGRSYYQIVKDAVRQRSSVN